MLGAHIDYLQQQGFPPLRIQGRDLKGDRLFIDAGISSQFITALLLIAPALQQGLSLELTGEIASRPYIEMTVELMRMSGAIIKWNDRIIRVEPSEYSVGKYRGEADWSAAAFFYELAAISPINELGLLALKRPSIQGDARCAELWEQLGVRTRDTVAGVSLEKTNTFATEIEADFFDHPDLFIPFACSCAAKGVKLIATGLRNLSIKESDRLTALCTELNRSGYAAEVLNSNTFILYPEVRVVPSVAPVIKTYQDHRMAMAFAVLAATFGEISLDDLTCTSKSFPGFAVALDHLGLSTKVAI
jgi:3-phosphoshikimate 1-carboxyvinyltransferase